MSKLNSILKRYDKAKEDQQKAKEENVRLDKENLVSLDNKIREQYWEWVETQN